MIADQLNPSRAELRGTASPLTVPAQLTHPLSLGQRLEAAAAELQGYEPRSGPGVQGASGDHDWLETEASPLGGEEQDLHVSYRIPVPALPTLPVPVLVASSPQAPRSEGGLLEASQLSHSRLGYSSSDVERGGSIAQIDGTRFAGQSATAARRQLD